MDKEQKKALHDLPGAAIDKADDGRTTCKEVKEEVRQLNDNPRSDDGPDVFGK